MTGVGRRIAGVLASLVLAGTLTPTLAGCSTSLKYGVWPRIEDLAKLQRRVSTPGDVRRILGEPRGQGEARLSIGHATIWFYDYGESASGRTRVKYLMVFLRSGAYDGHLWLDMETNLKERE
jgi:hypothetical protein